MTNEMKPAFPEVAPVIEVFPGIHATLMGDSSRFSNGSMPYLGQTMIAQDESGKIGEIGCNGGGGWVFRIGEAWYEIDMKEAFNAVYAAHIAALAVRG